MAEFSKPTEQFIQDRCQYLALDRRLKIELNRVPVDAALLGKRFAVSYLGEMLAGGIVEFNFDSLSVLAKFQMSDKRGSMRRGDQPGD